MVSPFIPLFIVLPLVAFWCWMAYDMVNNPDIPYSTPEPFRWPPRTKSYWLITFVVLNIFGAAYYYFTVYRDR